MNDTDAPDLGITREDIAALVEALAENRVYGNQRGVGSLDPNVRPEECAHWRAQRAAGRSVGDLAAEGGRCKSTVQKHANEYCGCSDVREGSAGVREGGGRS